MNIVSKVTAAYMKKNKKRTLVTIFGVIISVAMITAVLTSIVSFLDLFKSQEMNNSGSWMARYSGLTAAQTEQLKAESELSEVMLFSEVGYSPIGETTNPNKAYIYIQGMDAAYMQDKHLELVSGRLPEKDGEIVLSRLLLSDSDLDWEVGDTIELPIGHREQAFDGQTMVVDQNYSLTGSGADDGDHFVSDNKTMTYTVVGIIERPRFEYSWAPGYTAVTWLDAGTWPKDLKINAEVIFNKVDSELFATARDIGKEIGANDDAVTTHDELLRYYGVTPNTGMNNFLYLFGGLLIVIIMIGSILLIYNAFAISLSERSRQLGMLSSVGATRHQKRRSVLFEGAVIGCISIPLGLLAGIGGMTVTFKLINPLVRQLVSIDIELRCVVTPGMIVIAVLLAILTILVSSWIPAQRASRISPIDSIRQNKDIKLTRKQVRTSRLTRKLFGFEGELALKNLKRNKKSYRVTLISLVVSLALFLSVAGYITYLQKMFGVSSNTNNYDVYVYCASDDANVPSLFTTLPEVSKSNVVYKYYEKFQFNDADNDRIMDKMYKTYYAEAVGGEGEMLPLSVNFAGLPREFMAQYISDAGLDASLMDAMENPTDGHIPVIIVTRYHMITGSYQWADMTMANVRAGESYEMDYMSYEEKGEGVLFPSVTTMDIAGVTDIMPMGYNAEAYPGQNMTVFTLDTYVHQLWEMMADNGYIKSQSDLHPTVYMASEDPEALSTAVKKVYDGNPGRVLSYYSIWESEQGDRALLLMLQVFCFGFITLMTLICTANIVNTMSTGIELRRREFAMLKSVGMDPKAFNRMLVFESLFYGIKALLYGLPIGLLVVFLEYKLVVGQFDMAFILPMPYIIVAVVVLLIVIGVSMAYSFRRIRKENILDGLRTE